MSGTFPIQSLYSARGVLLSPFISLGLALFLLGFYVLLFVLVIYFLFLHSRKVIPSRKLHLAWISALFVVSTLSAICRVVNIVKLAFVGFRVAESETNDLSVLIRWVNGTPNFLIEFFASFLYVLANCIADAVLLYRCFIFWKSRKRIWIVLSLVVIATNGIGMTAISMILVCREHSEAQEMWSSMNTSYYIISAANSLLLSLVIAGQIWWVSRENRGVVDDTAQRSYTKAMVTVIESGLLYSLSLVFHVVIRKSASNFGFLIDTTPVISLMVGIAPTLIILRTSLGLSENTISDPRAFSSLRFRELPTTTFASEDSRVHTEDLQEESTSNGEIPETQKDENN